MYAKTLYIEVTQFLEWLKLLQELDSQPSESKMDFALNLVESSELGSRLNGSTEVKAKKLIRDARRVRDFALDSKRILPNLKAFSFTNICRDSALISKTVSTERPRRLETFGFSSLISDDSDVKKK